MHRTLLLLLFAGPVLAADAYKDGWTPDAIREAVGSCKDALVEGAWANTKKEQGVDPKMEMTADIRKQLAPQITAFEKLCDCTVRETAKKYGAKDYEQKSDTVGRYAVELVERGTCKVQK